jgi:hypothetical protein
MGPMRAAMALAMAAALAAGGEEMDTRAVGPGGRLFESPNVDELLARPYAKHVPMACTGERLWAAHPSGWGFKEGVHYYLLTSYGFGFDLAFEGPDGGLEPQEATAYPSHVAMRAPGGPLALRGAKWITADDVLVAAVTVANDSDAAVAVRCGLALPADGLDRDGDSFAWQARHHGLDVAFRGHAAGFGPEPAAAEAAAPRIWVVEGEQPASQQGSQGTDRKKAAGNGEVLGSNFGGEAGHFAEWHIDVPEAVADAVLSIRYARAHSGEGRFEVAVNGRPVRGHAFSSTGGWGDAPKDFAVAVIELGAVEPGVVRVRLTAEEAGSNVNFDRLAIGPRGVALPEPSRAETRLVRTIDVPARGEETIFVALAASSKPDEAEAAVRRVAGLGQGALDDQVAAYNRWLVENVPAFASVDEALTRQYWHRATSILKKSLFRVGEGRLTDWGIAEGRWNTTWYPNMISYGGGHQIRETRWLRDPQYVRGIISTWCANEKPNGVFPNFIRPDSIGDGQYTDWITATVWDAHCVAPDLDRLRAWKDALVSNMDGWLMTYDRDDDGLLLVDSHWWTGMEWQPSFFHFTGYDKDRQDQHLERVDLTAYVYGGAKSLGRILEALGDAEAAARCRRLAEKIAAAVEKAMWDEETKFFYSVEPKDHRKAMVKEVIGVYPFYFSMFPAGTKYAEAWSSILDPEEFWTTWPVASATKKCPAYSQDITFNGKEVGGCMWNGPTWPHANSIVLSAMAATLREHGEGPLRVEHFHELLRKFTMEQFLNQDLQFPWTGEYLNGDTGEWRTAERDYNHSTYIDIIIADYAGLRPRADDVLELHPLLTAETPGFVLDGVRYHGRDITLAWHREQDKASSPDGLTGYRVYVDGKMVHRSETVPQAVTLAL